MPRLDQLKYQEAHTWIITHWADLHHILRDIFDD